MKKFQAAAASILSASLAMSFLNAAATPVTGAEIDNELAVEQNILQLDKVCLKTSATMHGIQQDYFAIIQPPANMYGEKPLRLSEKSVNYFYRMYGNRLNHYTDKNLLMRQYTLAQQNELGKAVAIINQHRKTGKPDLDFCDPTI